MKMAKYSYPILATLASLTLILAGCTDPVTQSPGTNSDRCPSGQVYNEIIEECVDASSNTNGANANQTQTNQNPNQSDNQTQIDPSECDHPHAGRDALDPWGDESGDGVPNQYDNCPFDYNPDQTDTSGDGIGDACSRCPDAADMDQACTVTNPVDERGIIMGDVCAPGVIYVDTDTDTSGDGVPDALDNCPNDYNPDQIDTSGDGVGDVCDNCPNHYNPDQTASPGNPTDARGIVMGDACAPTPNNIPICETQTTEFERLKPNVYMALDISGSMAWTVSGSSWNVPPGESRWEIALEGLNQMADQIYADVRFGLGTFPGYVGQGCTVSHELNIGEYTAQQIRDSYNQFGPVGATPTYHSMMDIINNNRLYDPTDPLDSDRVKAVLLVTDGEPNCSPNYSGTGTTAVVNEVAGAITTLYNQGVLTYVVGFAFATNTLATFAQAGGTGDYLLADDADSLADAITEIADLLVSCSFNLNPPPPDPDKIWVTVDGVYLDRSDYTYNTNDQILEFSESACDQVRGIDAESLNMEILMGCAVDCVPEQPSGMCDLYYETCGAPYPCDSCSAEICDGQDNNCNGVIDEGCPDCAIYQGSCQNDDDCCEPFVCGSDNTCGHACYPTGVPCTANGQCCTGLCGIPTGEQVGQCIVG